jgi:hypothetical protein
MLHLHPRVYSGLALPGNAGRLSASNHFRHASGEESMSTYRKWVVAAALVAAAAAAGAAVSTASRQQGQSGASFFTFAQTGLGQRLGAVARSVMPGSGARNTSGKVAADAGPRAKYIVVFREAPLGLYKGEVAGLPAPKQRVDARGKLRLDARAPNARQYVNWLRGRQDAHEDRIARLLGRTPAIGTRMQHALNGIVVELGQQEAGRVRKLPEVRLVEEYREYAFDTDTGPLLIGAPAVWDGTATGAGGAFQGEGVVVGILDSGINFGSPSFAAADPVDGYVHTNPLGAGTYLGTCLAGGADEGRCNAKLIGGYDFVCNAPGNTCGQPNIREEPGFGDTNSHGSHTASTVAGNRRDASFRGGTHRISGVAPRANVVAFDICYTNTATNQGLCPNVSAVAAIEQAIADGVVDVFNYSIGGGTQPWGESVSLAFLSAVESGIYVAASAGNSGPAPSTLGHVEPWVASTAAAQHGRGDFAFLMQVTGPSPVPPALTAIVLSEGVNGVAHTAAIPATTPLFVSPGIDTANDGCAAFPAGAFTDGIAVIRRGTCPFTDKVNNATTAGAIAVVIANNAAGAIIPSVPGTTVPAFGATQSDGNALRDFAAANSGETAMIGYPAVALPNTPDALAAFSSRGPAGSFSLLKPDVTAPGVLVLAAVSGTTLTGSEQAVGLLSGTSMASPHQAGSAALLRQARPTWTVPEIKSALAMTAKPEVFLEDQVTPANPFARGSGRIRVDQAINAGLVMNETAENYLAADPAEDGDPTALNQPNLANRSCFESCTFVRTFRNTRSQPQTYHVRLGGLRGTVSPRILKVRAGGTASVRVTVDTSDMTANGQFAFGTLSLTPSGVRGSSGLPTLRLPVGVAVQPPAIVLPASVPASTTAGNNTTASMQIGNGGGSTLAFEVDNTGTGGITLVNVARGAVNSGFRSAFYSDPQPGIGVSQFASDDFTLAADTAITSIFTEGFTSSGVALTTAATSLRWSIYPDSGGFPAGNPDTAPGAAVWTYAASPVAPGVNVAGNNIGLDLVAAGQNVTLPPGRYWLVVNGAGTFANRWVWFASNDGDNTFATITPAAGGWAAGEGFAGLSMRIQGQVPCGASWLGPVVPPSGNVAPGGSQSVVLDILGAGLTAGNYTGNVCVASNDPAAPKAATPVMLTVAP